MIQEEIIDDFVNLWVENDLDSFDFEQAQHKILEKIEELERDDEL